MRRAAFFIPVEVKNVREIKGSVNTAVCYASVIEDEAAAQIRRKCGSELTEGCRIRIMPDVHAGEKVLIPVNMRDGSILAVGKGTPAWNCSGPHGAGRIMSRTRARESLDLEAYRREMAGVYTTSVSEAAIDEAPMAYKSLKDILGVIGDTVDVIEVLKPICNFKAG